MAEPVLCPFCHRATHEPVVCEELLNHLDVRVPPGAILDYLPTETVTLTLSRVHAEVASAAYPDATQFDPASPYFDPKSRREAPRWKHVDVKLVKKTRLLPLSEMRQVPKLAEMRTLKPGNRLSITPVTPAEWRVVRELLGA